MPEPCEFPSLDSCQKKYLWAHTEVPGPHKPRTNKNCLKSHIQKSSQSGQNTGHRITNGSWLTVLDTAQSRAYIPLQVLWSAELSVYPGKQLQENEPTVLVQLSPHPPLLVLHSSMSENQRKRLRVFLILNFNYVSLLIIYLLCYLLIYLLGGPTHDKKINNHDDNEQTGTWNQNFCSVFSRMAALNVFIVLGKYRQVRKTTTF